MKLFLNFGFVWISVILTIFLCIIYILRKVIVQTKGKNRHLVQLNKALRKHHKLIGIILIFTGLIHGYFSFENILSLNLGTVSWVVSILLGLSWMTRKSLPKYKGGLYYHRFLTAAFLLTIVLHVVQVGGIQVFNLFSAKAASSVQAVNVNDLNKSIQGATFKDGVYTGEADGYQPGLKVSVKISNNTITSIEIIDHNEVSLKHYQRAMDTIPQAILDNQSTDVDTVSGATFTSIGIMNAVNDALSQALISGTLLSPQQLPQNRGHDRGFGGREN